MKKWRFNRESKKQEQAASPTTPVFVTKDLAVNKQIIEAVFASCHDVKNQPLLFATSGGSIELLVVYCEGMTDKRRTNEEILPMLRNWFANKTIKEVVTAQLPQSWAISDATEETEWAKITREVLDGKLAIFINGIAAVYVVDTSQHPQRTPDESNTEVSVRGPSDGFIEEIGINVALIRKRLLTPSLRYEQFIVGRRSQTKVGLLYISDVVDQQALEEVKRNLQSIDVDALGSSAQLEELVVNRTYMFFPVLDYTGRPDFAVSGLLRGRFVIVVDGAPTVLIGPTNLFVMLKSPEDNNLLYIIPSFEILIRLMGLIIALFLPGFWVALSSFHQDQIPLPLLATLSESRRGVPFPAPIEAFIMLFMFELFREAGLRLPSNVGQTLSVVGGLIIGDAAIRAGLTSPSMVVLTAIASVSGFTLVNQSLTGVVSIVRLVVLFLSAIFGLFGFISSILLLVLYLGTVQSFGIPYLAPVSPFIPGEFLSAFVRRPWKLIKRRPSFLQGEDRTRQGDNQE
ncbi:spore germination protein [Aneurinibacillus sp. REN35]|uniref:spore germination protein n=1 Tax=Aneurinibacillus sp. REN35 TaxID=3237286 RepID=UPI0035286AFE